jgi:hypothetical protein
MPAARPPEHRLGAHAQAMSHRSGGQQWSIRSRRAELIEHQTAAVDRRMCIRRLSAPEAGLTRKARIAAPAGSAAPKVGRGEHRFDASVCGGSSVSHAGRAGLPLGRAARPLRRPEAA